ncbi:MAG: hypothetical protein WCK51_00875 [Armatimonadota bacterium]
MKVPVDANRQDGELKPKNRIGCGVALMSLFAGVPGGFILILVVRHLTVYHNLSLALIALSAAGCICSRIYEKFERQAIMLLCASLGTQLSPFILWFMD